VEEVQEPIKLRVKKFERAEGWRIPRDRDVACIDYDKLVFPLILRRWQHGDYFKPLGLDHLKKLSDFFVDRKYSRLEKEQAWLLTCGEKVVWVVGDRLDERFKVDRYTRHILQITYQRHT
jgi:tRNA(Ile)-lysidine synthase